MNDDRIVLTLDAGGTNFVFLAIQGNREIIEPITLPSRADDLNACLETIVEGFTRAKEHIAESPVAISFAFPGPADYPKGIIGDLGNLPAFRGGVALGPLLEGRFTLPVFINNDGDLFCLGEAIAGLLPEINEQLEKSGNPKRYKNLLGITLGTGFGGGIVQDGNLFLGDNSASAEVWLIRNKLDPETNAEEGVSIRAIQRTYAKEADISFEMSLQPEDIFLIGIGKKEGNKEAAIEAFRRMGEVAGDAIANAITLVDGLVIIGGGLTGASELFLPTIVKEMNSKFQTPSGGSISRMVMKCFNLEDRNDLNRFLKGDVEEIIVPDTSDRIVYDSLKRIGVGISRLGTSRATAIGAYAFALDALDGKK